MNDISATMGLDNLSYARQIIEAHRANAKFYDEAFEGLRRVKKLRYKADRYSSYWLYTVRVDDREAFQTAMKQKGIMVSQVHIRNDIHTAFKPFRRNLPGVDEFAAQQVSIPVGWWLSGEEREHIARAVREFDAR